MDHYGKIFSKDHGAERAFTGDEEQYHKPSRGSLPLQHKALFARYVLTVKVLKRTTGLFKP